VANRDEEKGGRGGGKKGVNVAEAQPLPLRATYSQGVALQNELVQRKKGGTI